MVRHNGKDRISSDVKGMFHQVRLLEEDKPFLCFLWQDMKLDEKPTVYKWQVLPFLNYMQPVLCRLCTSVPCPEAHRPGRGCMSVRGK